MAMHLHGEPEIVEWSYPTCISFGVGALSTLPSHARRLGMKGPLVVTDRGVVHAGIAERVYATLRGAGMSFVPFEHVPQNPTDADVSAGLAAYRAGDCHGIIGLGGGSPLDAAKLIALMVNHEPPLSRYDEAVGGDRHVCNPVPPIVTIPTAAGTGSEVGRAGIVVLADVGRKTVIFGPDLLPKVALCDPELTRGLSPHSTAAIGMDAFTHCVEAYLAKGCHPLADAMAIDGIARIDRFLPLAVGDGQNLAHRAEMMLASIQGAMAFEKGLGAAHSLAHALTVVCGLHHGLANALVLPTVMEFNREVCSERLSRVAEAMGRNASRPDASARAAIVAVEDLRSAIGLPRRLRDVGVREADLPLVASGAVKDSCHGSNARACTEDDLLRMLRAAH